MENVTNNINKENALDQHSPKLSIQQAFKKFQKEKFYQLKLNKYLKNIQVDRKQPKFKQQLRQKFVETAKKYIGVPYGQKYHQPGDPLYDAPLFIDCCALIRQCVFDLRQQFGFTLAKWNQAYQFDMLPDEGLKQQDLKVGDLIFYSATYYNPKLKPFPHKMVHVEIYMGQGKSIGARWQKGTIQIFDSYKFQSKLYYDIEFHYRSLDSWLQGKFENHCTEHKWLDDRANQWLSDKYSVFADPTLDDINLVNKQKQAPQEKKPVMIGKGNNCKLIRQLFEQKQDQYYIMPDKEQFSPHFFYKWVQTTGQVDFYSFKQGKQIVNHIANICVISSKLELLKTLKQLELQFQNSKKQLSLSLDEFLPKTYRLNIMSDEIEFLNDNTQGLWIYKPRNLNQGKGIKIISDIAQFKKQFIQSKKFYLGQFSLNNMLHYKPELDPTLQSNQSEDLKYSSLNHDGLIQHYIEPLLIDGRKFDIRCYMLVNSSPSLVLFHEGYLRLTIQQYSQQDIENQEKLFIHLTNNCYQHKHKDYKTKKQSTIADWSKIVETIGQEKTTILRNKIKNILVMVYAAAKKKLIQKRGTYELLGLDILVDKQCKPYLLQVNTNPAMFTQTKVQKEIIPKVLRNSIETMLTIFKDPSMQRQCVEKSKQIGFDLLYSEQQHFVYNALNVTSFVKSINKQKKIIILSVNDLEHHCQLEEKYEFLQQNQNIILSNI